MRGSVRKRSTWEYKVELGNQPCQRCECGARFWLERKPLDRCPKCGGELREQTERRQSCVTGFATKKAAQAALTDCLSSLQRGTYVEPARIILREYLTREWLPAIESTVKPSTYLTYKVYVERRIIPGIGNLPLQKLSGATLNAFYGRLLTEPRAEVKPAAEGEEKPKAKPPLSALTVRHVHAVLHRALKDAVRWGYVPRNVADQADPPKTKTEAGRTLHVWTVAELQTFLASTGEDRLYPLWTLLAMTGMRRGEVCGLRWSDMDLAAGVVAIQQARISVGYQVQISEPKTRRGRRAVDLDAGTIAVLKTWRKRQLEERMEWGALWTDTGFVFTRENGLPWHPDRISKLFDETVARVQKDQREEAERTGDKDAKILPRIRLHDLRHTHATVALAAGEHPKIVSERLGHANIAITLDTYSHVVPGLQKEAAARIGALVFGG